MISRYKTVLLGLTFASLLPAPTVCLAQSNCGSDCRRDVAALVSAVKTVNGHLAGASSAYVKIDSPHSSDLDLLALNFRAASAALKSRKKSGSSQAIEPFYTNWTTYLDAQASCFAARAVHTRERESNGGYIGVASNMFNLPKLLSIIATGSKQTDVILENCQRSRGALSLLQAFDFRQYLGGTQFVVDVCAKSFYEPWQTTVSKFRLIVPSA